MSVSPCRLLRRSYLPTSGQSALATRPINIYNSRHSPTPRVGHSRLPARRWWALNHKQRIIHDHPNRKPWRQVHARDPGRDTGRPASGLGLALPAAERGPSKGVKRAATQQASLGRCTFRRRHAMKGCHVCIESDPLAADPQCGQRPKLVAANNTKIGWRFQLTRRLWARGNSPPAGRAIGAFCGKRSWPGPRELA